MIGAVKPVVVKPARVVTPQCSEIIPADTRFEIWRKGRYQKLRPQFDPERCQRESTVQIDGRHYCSNHAGRIALAKWLKGDLVERGA